MNSCLDSFLHLRLFSRKLVIKKYASGRSSGSTPFLTFPLLQWSEVEMVSAKRIGLYSYGDSAGMMFFITCNRTSLLMIPFGNQPNATQRWGYEIWILNLFFNSLLKFFSSFTCLSLFSKGCVCIQEANPR